jgi:hypothetical protein
MKGSAFFMVLLFAALPGFLAAQAPEHEPTTPAGEADQADKLAQALANPVANLWSMTFQFNNYNLTNDRWNYN